MKRKKKLLKKKKKVQKKKTNLRSRTKNSALKPHLNLKTRYDEISDVLSYVDQLNEKEKAWLNSFVSEYINADFQHCGKKLHKSKKARKICTDRNNSRNRDILTKAKVTGNVVPLVQMSEEEELQNNIDNQIEIIDLKKALKGS